MNISEVDALLSDQGLGKTWSDCLLVSIVKLGLVSGET
jgi:hypothetical protein